MYRQKCFKKECIFTDGNAASSSTIFYDDTRYLNKLNWEIINSRYWGSFLMENESDALKL
jgi:hypothetical protein